MTYNRLPISFDKINEAARQRLPEVLPRLLPNGRLEGNEYLVGNTAGDPGRSLHIAISGPSIGKWYDFATAEGGGDPISLVAAVMGIGQFEAAGRLGAMLGVIDDDKYGAPKSRFRSLDAEEIAASDTAAPAPEPGDDEASRLAKARTLVSECVPVAGTPAAAYLTSRHIDPEKVPSTEVLFHPQSCSILYVARNAVGEVTGVQRVFLNPDGTAKLKPDGKKEKRTNGLLKGAAFTLPGDGSEVLVCDGPEDALSLFQATGAPVRCPFGMNWGETPLPEGASVVLVADNDGPDSPASKALAKAADRLAERGYRVKRTHPPAGVKDTNDLLREQGAESVRMMVAAAAPLSAAEPSEAPVPFDHKAEIIRLAKLSTLDYGLERDEAAKRLRFSPKTLDRLVGCARSSNPATNEIELIPDDEPWPSPVVPAELLDDTCHLMRRFVICDEPVLVAVALWVAFTWLIDWVQVAPLLLICAVTKRCGKTLLLSLVARLSRRSIPTSNISTAVLFRVIEALSPTVPIDEADTFLMRDKELWGILNSGHTRDMAYVYRLEGDEHNLRKFSTWGAKAIAGIGRFPETLTDRAIVVELRRRRKDEKSERLRHAEKGLFDQFRRKFARVAQDSGEIIGNMRPELPAELNDRAQDNWEPLLAIADFAGGHWPQTARAAALQLSGVSRETLSLSAELLADIRDIFEQRGGDRITTVDLIAALNADEEKPWATYSRGRPLTPRDLAKFLGEYGIKSSQKMENHSNLKGYNRILFEDVFARYLPAKVHESTIISPQASEAQESLRSSGPVQRTPLTSSGLAKWVPPFPSPKSVLPNVPMPQVPPPPPKRVLLPPQAPQQKYEPVLPPPPPPSRPLLPPPAPQGMPSLAHSGISDSLAAGEKPSASSKSAETKGSSEIADKWEGLNDIEL